MTQISNESVRLAAEIMEPGLFEEDQHSDNPAVIAAREIVSNKVRAALTAALQGLPANKSCFHDEVVFLREVDAGTDNACWVISNRVDPGAVAFFRGVSVARHVDGKVVP